MKFAAVIEYITDQDKIQSVRTMHRAYLGTLREQGRLAAAGPFTDGSGALIIYEAVSLEEAEECLRADPFNQHGVFLSWRIHPWNQVF